MPVKFTFVYEEPLIRRPMGMSIKVVDVREKARGLVLCLCNSIRKTSHSWNTRVVIPKPSSHGEQLFVKIDEIWISTRGRWVLAPTYRRVADRVLGLFILVLRVLSGTMFAGSRGGTNFFLFSSRICVWEDMFVCHR